MLVSTYASSFTSLGEQTELTIFDTPLNDEQVFAQISSEAYIGSDGLKVRASFAELCSTVSPEVSSSPCARA